MLSRAYPSRLGNLKSLERLVEREIQVAAYGTTTKTGLIRRLLPLGRLVENGAAVGADPMAPNCGPGLGTLTPDANPGPPG